MPELVPIKVKIVRGPDGGAGYPPFNQLPSKVRGEQDWSVFFESHGLGWHYDTLSGFGVSDLFDEAVDNDHPHANPDPDIEYGATCIPKDFALAAVTKWPNRVELLSEESWAQFYDERAHANDDTENLDTDALQGLKARLDLEAHPDADTVAPSAEIVANRKRMLDPNDKKPGIRKNRKRRWVDYKKLRGVTIAPPE